MSSFRVVILSIPIGSHSEYFQLSVSASLVPICGGWSLPFDKVELLTDFSKPAYRVYRPWQNIRLQDVCELRIFRMSRVMAVAQNVECTRYIKFPLLNTEHSLFCISAYREVDTVHLG
jgi:hypothetical protein